MSFDDAAAPAVEDLPAKGSPEFWQRDKDIQTELAKKFAWTAQQQGIVYRNDPLKAVPMNDSVFNRVSRSGHSFRYKNEDGRTKVHFYRFDQILAALDDDALDFGFVMAEGLDFLPGQPEITRDALGRKLLNLWRPPGWTSNGTHPEPTLFLEHMRYLFDADQAAIDHVLDFVAHLIQRPEQRVNHALLITSEAKGIGKSTLGTIVRRLVGENNSRVAQTKDLKSQFDGWLVGKLVVQIDEVYEHGNWDLANKLKPLITEPTISVNMKYGPQLEILNFARMIMFSNHSAPMDIEEGDRRYFIFESSATARDTAYYDALNAFIDSDEGMNSIFSYLARRDLTRFRPYAAPPMTEAKRAIVEVSGNPLRQYIIEATASGHLRSSLGPQFTMDALQRQLASDGYGAHAKNMKELGAALEAAGVTKVRVGQTRKRMFQLPDGPQSPSEAFAPSDDDCDF